MQQDSMGLASLHLMQLAGGGLSAFACGHAVEADRKAQASKQIITRPEGAERGKKSCKPVAWSSCELVRHSTDTKVLAIASSKCLFFLHF
jgi:hypothetical protein